MSLKSTLLSFSRLVLLLFVVLNLNAQNFTETFITAPPVTWNIQNLSSPVGTTTWRQGSNSDWSSYDIADGIGNDYAFADFDATATLGTISCWLISPTITTLSNGDTITFYTRTATVTNWGDRLQVKLSTNGASTNVGTTEFSVGDFSYQQLDINPTYDPAGFPTAWTQYTIIVSGLPAGNQSGRIAFRYFVENAGSQGLNSYQIGVDLVHYGNQGGGGGGTLTTGTISPTSYCAGSNLSVPFSSSGITFVSGNVFTAQLSDASGGFSSPISIGTLTSTSTSGTISATIPALSTPGGYYRIRVVASTPSTTGTQNSTNLFISRAYPPTFFANPSTSICSGGTVTLSAIPFERFYGYDAFGGNFVRFNSTSPGTLVNVGIPVAADYYSGDFGPDGYYVLDGTTNAFAKVDITTGVPTNLGNSIPSAGYQWTGLAWNAARSNFYATAANQTGDTSQLYRISLPNGTANLIGNITNCPLAIWIAIANNGATYVLDIANDNLLGVSLTTGAGTIIGSVGFDANYAQDADVDPVTGTLYLSAYNNTTGQAELRTANTTTGATTLLGALGANPANTEICALAIAGYSSYSWSPGGATTSSISVNSSGTYTVTVTNPTGCSASASQLVTIGTVAPSISPSNPSVCSGSSVQLTASGGNAYSWSTGGNTASISVNTQGTYTVTVTGSGNCTATASVTVTGVAPPLANINPSNPAVCSGSSVQLTASGGNAYSWSTGSNTATINVNTQGTYTVTVTGNGACTATASVGVTASTTPTVSISPSNPSICGGNSITLTASGGSSYNWSNGGNTAAISVNSQGIYTVTATGNSGCTASTSVNVTSGIAPTAGISPANPSICGGNSVTLTALGGNSYVWSTGGNIASINVNTIGTYTVTVTGNGGCTATASVNVTSGTPPVASITAGGSTTFCQGNSLLLTASGGSSYAWSNGDVTAGTSVASTGLYTVTVTNANGCTATASQNVTVNSSPSPTITPSGSTNICPGNSVTLTAGGGNSYLWSNGSTLTAITVNTTGTYTVTVTGANSCTATTSQSVAVQSSAAAINASGATQFCQGGNVTLTSSAGNSYLWSNGATSNSITVNTSGIYAVTVTFSGGCSATASQQVGVLSAPVATISPNGTIALCPARTITLSASGGSNYLWSNGATTSSTIVSTAGQYTVTVTDGSGCTASATQGVTQVSNPAAAIIAGGATTFCSGSSLTLTGSGGTSYVWSTGATTTSITVNVTGIYSVTATDANTCSASTSQNVIVVVPTAAITPGGPTTFCPGGNVTLTANSGSSYLWSNGSTTNSINVTTAGTYVVTVVDGNNCTASASQTITIDANPTTSISINGSGVLCATGGSETLTAGAGTAYLWSNGATTQSIVVTTPATYTVTVSLGASCSAIASQTITQATPITVTGITTPSTGNDGAINITVAGAFQNTTYLWSNGSANEDISGLAPGTYTVTVTDSRSCTATQTFSITAVGVADVSVFEIFNLYPNPTQNLAQVIVKTSKPALIEFKVNDALGNIVYYRKTDDSGELLFELDTRKWAAGLYYVSISTEKQQVIKKLSVIR